MKTLIRSAAVWIAIGCVVLGAPSAGGAGEAVGQLHAAGKQPLLDGQSCSAEDVAVGDAEAEGAAP